MSPLSMDASVHSSSGSIPAGLLALPDEVLQRCMAPLDIADLLSLSRVSKRLHALCTDPWLHALRLKRIPYTLDAALATRPTRTELSRRNAPVVALNLHDHAAYPYSQNAANQVAAYLALGRIVRRQKLSKAMDRRASLASLLERGLLDAEAWWPTSLDDGAGGHMSKRVAPALAPAMRQLKKAQKVDSLKQRMRYKRRHPDDGATAVTHESSQDVEHSEFHYVADWADSWKTHTQVFESSRHVWRDDDPRVVYAVCTPVKSRIRFWEGMKD